MPLRLTAKIAAKTLSAALALALAPAAHAQDYETPDPTIERASDDPKMLAATAEAQRTLPEWLAVLADPPPGTRDVMFKFPLEGYEHIWVENVTREGGYLQGTLSNVPHAEGWSWGDFVRVPLSDVSDWSYRDPNGLMHGHRATRALFPQMPPELVAEIKADFGW